jgi:hypothetical protein
MANSSQMRQATERRASPGRRSPGAVWRRAAVLGATLAVPLGWLCMAPAEASPLQDGSGSTKTATVADTSEAWYANSPVDLCTTPLGCPPQQAPTSPYPADTLHVGAAGGQETARTYVLPNLLTLPYGATAISGVMTLPVDSANTDGSVAPDSATMLACLATAPFTDGTAGAAGAAPKIDCKTSVKAEYDAKKIQFTVDLLPFLKAWSAGTPSLGIALVPDPSKTSPTETWHVTINGRKLAGKPHISSVITYQPPPPTPTGGTGTQQAPAPTPPKVNPPPVSVPNVPPSTTTPDQPAPVVAPSQAPAPVAQPVAFSRPFQYPLAFLAPIGLLIGIAFFARLFTRDPLPRRVGAR